MFDRDPILHYMGQTNLTWNTNYSWLIFCTAWVSAHPLQRSIIVKFLESPTLTSQGPTVDFYAIGWSGQLRLFAIWRMPFGGSASSNITHMFVETVLFSKTCKLIILTKQIKLNFLTCYYGIKTELRSKHTHTHRDLCHSWRIWGRILPAQVQPYDILIQDPLRWSWSILFEVGINQKLSILKTFCPCIK